jgi:TolB-like protein/Tfp pilus assembly protein PilF
MKRCPQCNRVETDDALLFCRADGTALVNDPSPVGSETGTARFVSAPAAAEIETSILPHTTVAAMNRGTAPTTVLPTQQPPSTTGALTKSKRSWVIIAGVLLIAAVLTVAGYFYLTRKDKAAIQSIAVMPFVNESGNADVEYLSDGMTESLISSLSQLPKLNVKARSSVFRYKGKEADIRTIGKELNVQAILNGRVVQRGDEVVLYLELVDTQTGNRIWGDQYNKKLANLVALQNEIALDVSQKLKTKLSGAEEQHVTKNYTANSEAYQLYLKGRFYWNKRTVDDYNRAIPNFQQAIDKDPNYALAYSGLADSYTLLATSAPPKDFMPQAKSAAMKALALDANLAEAHASLGQIIMYYDWDFNGAEHEFSRALELNPNYATAHQWHAENLSSAQRHEEALAEIRRALELDPLSLIVNRVYGDVLLNARRYDNAIEQYRKTIEMDPNFPSTHARLVRAYEARGMYDQAAAELMKVPGLRASPETVALMKETYARSGWKAFLRARLDDLLERSKKEYAPPFAVASLYARLGQKDEAFAWLEKAYQSRDYQMSELEVRSDLDSLRSDPRFAELVRRVGFAR